MILGASDVGKTALIHRYIEGTFKKEANVSNYESCNMKPIYRPCICESPAVRINQKLHFNIQIENVIVFEV